MHVPKLIAILSVAVLIAGFGAGCRSSQTSRSGDPAWVAECGAKKLPTATTEFNVATFGAKNDGTTLNTVAIQKTIDAAAAKGGIVTFAPGKYLTGSLFLKSGVHFRLDAGVELLGSQDLSDYPIIDTRVAGIEMKWPAGLLNIEDAHTVRISGAGKVNAQGKPFWDAYWALRKEYEPKGLRWIVDYDAQRPRTLIIARSKDVTVEGITLEQAGFWTVHILYSSHVTCDGLIIRNNVGGHGPSTDGIDIDSSSYVLAQNCDIDCNDDDFCIKSGRDADGLRVDRPTEYIVIQNCIARKGGGLITFGSETSGGFRHILARNLRGEGTKIGIRFKSATTRGGLVEDIRLENIRLDDVVVPIEITMDWNASYSYSKLPAGYDPETVPAHWKALLAKVEPPERGIPRYRNVIIKNVVATGAKTAISAAGLPQSKLENFRFENVSITAEKAGSIRHAKGWSFKDVTVKATDPAPLQVEDSTDMDVVIGR